MAWVRLDDAFPDHPKILAVGLVGQAIHVRALCYCAKHLTDGFIPAQAIQIIANGARLENISKLVSAGLWDAAEGGYQIHDYLDYNPSKKTVISERKRTTERVRLWRENNRNAVTGCVTEAEDDSSVTLLQTPLVTPLVTPPPSRPLPGSKGNLSGASHPRPSGPAPTDLLEHWNRFCGPLPKAKGLDAKRNARAKALLARNPDLTVWDEAIQRITRSPFCRGETERGWRATFDWLLQPSSLLKVQEGTYDPAGPVARKAPVTRELSDEEHRRIAEAAHGVVTDSR